MHGSALFPGVTISPVVPDVPLVSLSTLFTSADHRSSRVLHELERKLQTELRVTLDLGEGCHQQ